MYIGSSQNKLVTCITPYTIMSKKPLIKTAEQIDRIRHAGQLLNQLLILVAHAAQP